MTTRGLFAQMKKIVLSFKKWVKFNSNKNTNNYLTQPLPIETQLNIVWTTGVTSHCEGFY